jgi:hypothetical protein
MQKFLLVKEHHEGYHQFKKINLFFSTQLGLIQLVMHDGVKIEHPEPNRSAPGNINNLVIVPFEMTNYLAK